MKKYRGHTTHYVCDEILKRDGGKAIGCCCTGHECKVTKKQDNMKKEARLLKNNTILIPGELSGLNQYIAAVSYNRYAGGTMKREATDFVYMCCMDQNIIAYTESVTITFKWYMKNKKKDLDNVCFGKKFILDGMVKAGVIVNDTQEYIKGFTDEFYIDKNDPRIEVVINLSK